SNLASGIVVILSKPFALDDYVKIGDSEGTVKEIGFVYTILGTIDNKKILIPNSQVSASKVVNFSAEKMRRLDLTFSIGYNDDIKQAKEIILNEIKKTGLALQEPNPPFVGVGNHGASSIDLTTRIWVPTEDYWTLNFELLENVKYAFDENHISIPFNQLDVHING
ncbi:MAG: mechanosensitive ion channel family protein, partial [Oscillospiraceae bacterium]